MGLLLVVCSLSALLLLLPASATPALTQSLKQQLQEELLPLQGPEELLGADMLKAVYGAPEEGPWEEDPSNSALADKENALSRLLKDLMRTSKRSWSRYKKGNLRSCFGVRLERIGSFSGLGC
ncbi:natriuretic peptide A-like isoform X1 [Eucyclogobius newberryi]|uniref:natriuretic peptide A-like isoform X1 n=1 Tax=Eucyclogobius newberryi TaxID=166745 RepID=UPI003B5B45F1